MTTPTLGCHPPLIVILDPPLVEPSPRRPTVSRQETSVVGPTSESRVCFPKILLGKFNGDIAQWDKYTNNYTT